MTSNTVASRPPEVQRGSARENGEVRRVNGGARRPPGGQTGFGADESREADVIGSTGRVTGAVGAGLVGEVMVHVPERRGAEAFLAYLAVPGDRLVVGTPVVVIEYQPPRTVYVAPIGP